MSVQGLRVIVVGAATGGCAAALLLARAGARVTLVERVARPTAVGAGIALAANGMAVLESMGLGPALAAARPATAPRIVDGRGRTLLAPPARADIRLLRRATLQGVLHDAVAAEPGITRRFGCEVERVDATGHVTLRREDGALETLSGDLVVGADGARSRVRASLDVGARVDDSGIDYLRALVDAPATECEAWTAAGLFGSFAVDGGTYLYASASTPATRAAVAARDLDALRAAWATAYPDGARLLAHVRRWDDLLVNRVSTVTCARWSQGQVALLGDAAHAMAPNLGQGANSALVDAAVLLDSLRGAGSVRDALVAYEARRKPRVTRVARMAARLGRLAELTGAIPRLLRDRVLLPVAARLLPDPAATVLQEPVETLRAIGRA